MANLQGISSPKLQNDVVYNMRIWNFSLSLEIVDQVLLFISWEFIYGISLKDPQPLKKMIFKMAIVFLVLIYTFWNTNATEIMIIILLVMLKMVHDQICIFII